MVLSRKGQVALVALMIGVMVFVLAMIFIDPIKDVITESRGVTQLDCANASISDGTKATCLVVDLILPYFIVIVIAVGGAYITAKFV